MAYTRKDYDRIIEAVWPDYRDTDGPHDRYARRILDLQQQVAARDMNILNQNQTIAHQNVVLATWSQTLQAQREHIAPLDQALSSLKQQVEQLTVRLNDSERNHKKAAMDAKAAADSAKGRQEEYDRRIAKLDEEKPAIKAKLRSMADNI
ncbi:hypothetical protein CLAFUW4_04089 [Fulvia fulva]|nr:hypothetical protein CLAFUR4_04075 [Fulvia fulva]WPV13820.1 hypothetical protein CLAFUW4_04089 [Fulvia fulva]WPV28630.1 hypothetical protein CLAFUW7_04078 [Fulvia fulva]